MSVWLPPIRMCPGPIRLRAHRGRKKKSYLRIVLHVDGSTRGCIGNTACIALASRTTKSVACTVNLVVESASNRMLCVARHFTC